MRSFFLVAVLLIFFSCANDSADCPVCPDPTIPAKCGLSDLAYYAVDTTYSVVWHSTQQDGLELVGSFLVIAKLCTEAVDTVSATREPNGWYSVDGLSLNYYKAKHNWPEFTLQGFVVYRDGVEPNTTDLVCKTPCLIWREQGGEN